MWVITKQTILNQLFSWSFVFLVFSPLFFIGITSVFKFVLSDNSTDKIILVDESRTIKELPNQFELSKKNLKQVKQEYKYNEVASFVRVSLDKKGYRAAFTGHKNLSETDRDALYRIMVGQQQILNQQRLKLTLHEKKILYQTPEITTSVTQRHSKNSTEKMIGYWSSLMIMYFVMIIYSTSIAQEIANEKGTRIMEIIFSSMPANRYFLGKVFGFLIISFVHIFLYFLFGILIVFNLDSLNRLFHISNSEINTIKNIVRYIFNINWLFIFIGVVFVILISAFFGALVNRAEDGSKAAQPALQLIMLSFLASLFAAQFPRLFVVKLFSFLPFFSTFFMPLRIINGTASLYEIIISLLAAVISLIGFEIIIGKVYGKIILQTESIDLSFKSGYKFLKSLF